MQRKGPIYLCLKYLKFSVISNVQLRPDPRAQQPAQPASPLSPQPKVKGVELHHLSLPSSPAACELCAPHYLLGQAWAQDQICLNQNRGLGHGEFSLPKLPFLNKFSRQFQVLPPGQRGVREMAICRTGLLRHCAGDWRRPTLKDTVVLALGQAPCAPRHSESPPLAWGCTSALCMFSWLYRSLNCHRTFS